MERIPLQQEEERNFDFSKRAIDACRARVETLLRQVFEQLLLRNRSVKVGTPSAWWRAQANGEMRSGFLDRDKWGCVSVLVDDIKFAFQWTPVRNKQDQDYAQDRLRIRVCRDPEAGWRGYQRVPSEDALSLLEPKAKHFDPVHVVETLERYLVERRQARQRAHAARVFEENRAAAAKGLRDAALQVCSHVGASNCEARVYKKHDKDDVLQPAHLKARLEFKWDFSSPEEAYAFLVTLSDAFAAAKARAAEDAFRFPE